MSDVSPSSSDRVQPFLEELRAEGMGFAPDEGQWFVVGARGSVAGVGRVRARDDALLLDDVYVRPDARRNGHASTLVRATMQWASHRADALWLLADEDMVAFYESFGFVSMGPAEFPRSLATLCEAQGEWPSAGDHVHVAMRALLSSSA